MASSNFQSLHSSAASSFAYSASYSTLLSTSPYSAEVGNATALSVSIRPPYPTSSLGARIFGSSSPENSGVHYPSGTENSPSQPGSVAAIAPFPITASPFDPFNSTLRPNFPTTAGLLPSNASMGMPYIEFGCTTTPGDPGHDERSCSCLSQALTWEALQSTGETTRTICHSSGQMSYGYEFSAGCAVETSALFATPWVAPESCCAYCSIVAPTVRIAFWESPETLALNLTTIGKSSLSTASTVVDDGFTL